MKVSLVVACAAGFTGCANEYVYQPAEQATAEIHGRVAADYQIPASAPEGDVRIASFGISKISPQDKPEVTERAIHLRMIVANNSARPWSVDTRQVRVAIPGAGKIPPAYVTTREGQGGLPSVIVGAGGQRVIDLFYPLPANMQSARRIPEFDVVWRVQTETQVVAERTPFDRLRAEPTYAAGYGPEFGFDWGMPGPWYDPWYSGYPMGPDFFGGPVVVGPPSWGGGGGEEEHEHGRR